MDFDANQWLQDHENDPVKALNAMKAKWDAEGKAAALARRQRDDAKGERDGLQDKLTEAEKRSAPEGATVLTGDDATAWQTFKGRGGLKVFDEAEQVKKERDELQREQAITKAALALGKPQDALAEILEGKTLTSRPVKAEDGKESQEWGIGEGDKFKPLSEMRSIQLLGTAEKPAEQPKAAPTGVVGGKNAPADPVDALNAQLFGQPKSKN